MDRLISVQYTKLLWNHKFILIRWGFLTAVLSSLLALSIPKTFKSTAVLMPPKSQSDQGVLANIEGFAFADMFASTADDVSNAIFAILKSRTMMESVIKEMNLIEVYESVNMEEAVKSLKENLRFDHLEEGTISVSAFAQTPWFSGSEEDEKARNLVQSIVTFLISELEIVNKTQQTDEARYHRKFMEKRYNESVQQLRIAEENLRTFQHTHNTMDLAEQTKAAIRVGADIKSQILIDEVRLGILKQSHNSHHPEIQKLQLEIRELENQLRELDYQKIGSQSKEKNLFPHFSEVPDLEIELMRLKREVEIQSKLYAFLTQQFEDSKIQEARDTPTIQVLDTANLPIKRHKPKRTLMVIGYTLIAGIITSLAIILKELNLPESSFITNTE